MVIDRKAGWNFDICGSEDIQFTEYGVGQYYDWHTDSNIRKRY